MNERTICLERLKHLKILRILVSPYKNWKICHLYKNYLKSDDFRRFRQIKDTHKGERCFIIGNGPSLRPEDLDRLKREFTFAANRIYEIFDKTTWRPTVYIAVDEDFLRDEYQNISKRVPCKIRLHPFYFCKEMVEQDKERNSILIWLGARKFEINKPAPWAEKAASIPEDISLGFGGGRTVTFDAIQVALYMGFQEIYLIGVDFSYSRVIDENGVIQNMEGVEDYFNKKSYDTAIQYYGPTKHAYEVAREYCDAHGITIRNATRGGKLEVFERVDLDEVLQCSSEEKEKD